MRSAVLSAALLFLLPAAGRAEASRCEASYAVEGRKPTRWFDLGEVAGAQKKANCVAKARNHLAEQGLADLGLPRSACAKVPVSVTLFTRLDAKGRREEPDAVVKASFDSDCGKAKPGG